MVNIRSDSPGNPSFDKSLTLERTRQHDNVDGELSTFASYFPRRVFSPRTINEGCLGIRRSQFVKTDHVLSHFLVVAFLLVYSFRRSFAVIANVRQKLNYISQKKYNDDERLTLTTTDLKSF